MSTSKKFVAYILATVMLGPGIGVRLAHAQPAIGSQGGPATPVSRPTPDFDILQGRWVRPDGGYVIAIKAVDAGGKLDASYANPRPLPFAKAEASRDGNALKVFLELRAGGYDGSTYTLTYDRVNDVLRGIYYQAVAKQSYDVVFARAR